MLGGGYMVFERNAPADGVRRMALKFRALRAAACLAVALAVASSALVTARAMDGDQGYWGGVSSGEVDGRTQMEYREVCFLSGTPIELSGTLTLRKTERGGNVTAVYQYSLRDDSNTAMINRTLTFVTTREVKPNGQKIDSTVLDRFTEQVVLPTGSYALRSYDYTRTCIYDPKAAIEYYSGNIWSKKTYAQAGNQGRSPETITVEEVGEYYGYNGYWGSAQTLLLDGVVRTVKEGDSWGGTFEVRVSSGMTREMMLSENRPDAISFRDGYLERQRNEGVMEYRCAFPEMDRRGVSTDVMVDRSGSLRLETFPSQVRLPVPDLWHLRGHFQYEAIRELYSLEILPGEDRSFKPEQFMTRAEFASALDKLIRPAPVLNVSVRTSARSTARNAAPVASFADVPVGGAHFEAIESVLRKRLMNGIGGNNFSPNGPITYGDAVTVLVRALGLEGLAPNPNSSLTIADAKGTPAYQRNALYVAERIGLIRPDARGNYNPGQRLTNAMASRLFCDYLDYMRSTIRKDYRDHMLGF
ncbi:MAG: S-layer homology domain-containing protein [Oscillospiraceae bacterium]|nr:S-layer homology domain-containing protein [Oscillospiraceae bacterium]